MENNHNPHGLFLVPEAPVLSLEARTAAELLRCFRETEGRKALMARLGADNDAIEAALTSAYVREKFQRALAAFLIEQTPGLVIEVVASARKDHKSGMWKFFMNPDVLAEFMRGLLAPSMPDAGIAILSPKFEGEMRKSIREIEEGKSLEATPTDRAES